MSRVLGYQNTETLGGQLRGLVNSKVISSSVSASPSNSKSDFDQSANFYINTQFTHKSLMVKVKNKPSKRVVESQEDERKT